MLIEICVCRSPEYGIRVGPGVQGGLQGLLQDLQTRLPAADEIRASAYLPDHFLHTLRGLQDIISLPQFRQGQLQVGHCACAFHHDGPVYMLAIVAGSQIC